MKRTEGASIVVLGAGVAGLGAGLALAAAKQRFRVLETEHEPGGLARTDEVDGFCFDHTAHCLHFRSERIRELFGSLGLELHALERHASVLVDGRKVPYPVQYNLSCLEDPELARRVVDELERGNGREEQHASFGDLLDASWGEALVELFFRPYNEKLWGRPLAELPVDCAGTYLPAVDVELARRGASERTVYSGYNATFHYPSSGRLGDVMWALARLLGDRVRYGVTVEEIDLERRLLVTTTGEAISYTRLISTIPLDRLLAMSGIATELEPETFDATSIVNVRIGARGSALAPDHWVYVADPDVPFHRIAFPHNFSSGTCPDGCVSVSAEYTERRDRARPDPRSLATAALEYVVRAGLVSVDECLTMTERVVAPAYVVHRADGRRAFGELAARLSSWSVELAGRYGTWNYLSIEEAFASGERAVESCLRAWGRA